jgi:hypothetical protein
MRSSDARVDVESEVLIAPPRDATDMRGTLHGVFHGLQLYAGHTARFISGVPRLLATARIRGPAACTHCTAGPVCQSSDSTPGAQKSPSSRLHLQSGTRPSPSRKILTGRFGWLWERTNPCKLQGLCILVPVFDPRTSTADPAVPTAT